MKYSEMDEDMQFKLQQHVQRVPDRMLSAAATIFAGDRERKGGVGITLYVGGSAFSGTIVTAQAWAEVLADMPGDGSALISETMLKLNEAWDSGRDEKPSDEEWDALGEKERIEYELNTTTGFIHLVDAQYFQGGQVIPEKGGMPMRFRLSEVQGWTFGKMERSEN